MTTIPAPGADLATDEPNGTFECPICGKDSPHAHDKSETIRFHQYRPAFEVEVFKRIHHIGHSMGCYAVDSVDINGHRLGYPASEARGRMEWGELAPTGDGYAREWMQTMWKFYKDGIRASLAAVPASEPVQQLDEMLIMNIAAAFPKMAKDGDLSEIIGFAHAVRTFAATTAPVPGMPDLASLPVYERPKRGWQGVWNTAPTEKFYFVADVVRLLKPTGETK